MEGKIYQARCDAAGGGQGRLELGSSVFVDYRSNARG
jgi:hypothetical protein